MNKQYIAKIGTPDELRQIDSDSDRELVVPGTNAQEVHKNALNKCKGTEEVLTIIQSGKVVFDYKTGFSTY